LLGGCQLQAGSVENKEKQEEDEAGEGGDLVEALNDLGLGVQGDGFVETNIPSIR